MIDSIFGVPFSNIVGVLLTGGAGTMTWVVNRSFFCDQMNFAFTVEIPEGDGTARVVGPLSSIVAVVSA
jgi:hypothetical protein